MHGREASYIEELKNSKGIVLLTDDKNTPYVIAKNTYEAGYKDMEIVIGERLSYPDERITFVDIENYKILDREFAMNIVIVRRK